MPERDAEPPTDRERARLDDHEAVLDLRRPLQPELIAPRAGAVRFAPTNRAVQREPGPARRATVYEVEPSAARQIHAAAVTTGGLRVEEVDTGSEVVRRRPTGRAEVE